MNCKISANRFQPAYLESDLRAVANADADAAKRAPPRALEGPSTWRFSSVVVPDFNFSYTPSQLRSQRCILREQEALRALTTPVAALSSLHTTDTST